MATRPTPTSLRKKDRELILGGTMISIDPSCGSQSSLPGYAIYGKGVLQESGVLEIDISKDLPYRLQELNRALVELGPFDVLCYENIAPRRFGGGGATGHASLLKSVGVVLGAVSYKLALGLRPNYWKRHVSRGYIKSDEADAIEMGRILIDIARGEITSGGKKKSRSK